MACETTCERFPEAAPHMLEKGGKVAPAYCRRGIIAHGLLHEYRSLPSLFVQRDGGKRITARCPLPFIS